MSDAYYWTHREAQCAKAKANRERRKAESPDGLKQHNKDRHFARKLLKPGHYILTNIRTRAKLAGVPFDLDASDLTPPDVCPVLGIKMTPYAHGRCDTAPEVDRLVPEKGYVRGNVSVISRRANRIKDNGSAEEHERIAAWMRSRGAQ